MNKILYILLLPTLLCAQNIKIGDISISEALAKEYFLDCHQRPDTIFYNGSPELDHKLKQAIYWYRNPKFPNPENKPQFITVTPEHRIKRKSPNMWSYALMLVPREPSAADFRDWYLRRNKVK